MKTKYDVLVIGSGTAGIYFAHEMAVQGYSVCVTDRLSEEALGQRLNVFHTDTERFVSYGVPEPKPGDEDFLGIFDYGLYRSAFDRYEKRADYPFTIALLPPFLKRMRKWAEAEGVEFVYETSFYDFICDSQGRTVGAKLLNEGRLSAVRARLVADCSGIPSVARRKLIGETKVERFEIGPRDKFYVLLRYVKLKNPERDRVSRPTGWAYYKTWIGSSDNQDGAILGIGTNLSFEYAEECYQKFERTILLPEYELDHMERGVTPYHRPPYSLVDNGFVALGDAACMTKPYSGEGITAGWVGCKIAAEVAGAVMKDGSYPSEEKLWPINLRYHTTQGADFAYIMATLVNAIDCTPEENEYEFKNDIVFTTKALTRMNRNFNADMPIGESLGLVGKALIGLITKNIRFATIKNLLKGVSCAAKLKSHYKKFPKKPNDASFERWKKKAEKLWEKTGTMSDVIEKMEAAKKQAQDISAKTE